MKKRALITGITGQDGSYLAELLLEKGYQVHGIVRRASSPSTSRIDHLLQASLPSEKQIVLHFGDMADSSGLRSIVETVQPHEVYNLAAQSHVKVSFDQPEYTADVVGLGTLRLLEAARAFRDRSGQDVRFYQASSSEMFGAAKPPQSILTPFHPRSPYAVAKVQGFWHTVNHRESYGMFNCNGILFNHEGPRRGETFVTRKITRAVGRIKVGLQEKLALGNLEALRDWGHARDFVEAMWMMLQHDTPGDYVVATGEAHSVREFAQIAFAAVDLNYEDFVTVDPRFFRPAEVDFLLGDISDIKARLGWQPRTTFAGLVQEMVMADLEIAQREKVFFDANPGSALKGSIESL